MPKLLTSSSIVLVVVRQKQCFIWFDLISNSKTKLLKQFNADSVNHDFEIIIHRNIETKSLIVQVSTCKMMNVCPYNF